MEVPRRDPVLRIFHHNYRVHSFWIGSQLLVKKQLCTSLNEFRAQDIPFHATETTYVNLLVPLICGSLYCAAGI